MFVFLSLQHEWEAHIGFPPTYPVKTNEYEKVRAGEQASTSEVDTRCRKGDIKIQKLHLSVYIKL
jgi:hypothetical protein